SPTVSAAKATSAPSSSPRRAATGAREYRGSGSPFGRPRGAHTTTRAPTSTSRVIVGSEARIRPSSVMVSPSRGTLRSERTRTRLPRRSPRSARVFTDAFRLPTVGSEGGTDEVDEVDDAVGVAPLVVVPADHLDLVADDLRQAGVEDAARRVGLDVLGDDRGLRVGEQALHRALGRGLAHDLVDLLDGGLPAGLEGEVGGRAGRDRDAKGVAVEL